MSSIAFQITSLTIVYSTVYSGANQRKHQSSASLAFVCGEFTVDRWIPRKKVPVTRKMFPFDDVIMHYVRSAIYNEQSGRSPKVVALFSVTHFSSYIIELLQLQFKLNETMHESTIIDPEEVT